MQDEISPGKPEQARLNDLHERLMIMVPYQSAIVRETLRTTLLEAFLLGFRQANRDTAAMLSELTK